MTKEEIEIKKLEEIKAKPGTDEAMKSSIDKRIAILKGKKSVYK